MGPAAGRRRRRGRRRLLLQEERQVPDFLYARGGGRSRAGARRGEAGRGTAMRAGRGKEARDCTGKGMGMQVVRPGGGACRVRRRRPDRMDRIPRTAAPGAGRRRPRLLPRSRQTLPLPRACSTALGVAAPAPGAAAAPRLLHSTGCRGSRVRRPDRRPQATYMEQNRRAGKYMEGKP
ncbi:hypothetical protein PVAP13_2NG394306 [Panicum virgatum]|uniref:Uncharacterized protein n=1 Tax=Panicum virgatum TaxID=38727 RepID=A0A8T0VKF0_PANVG|nr:hypothetical protein PVAP13_2NG394306 [Panicum virgatum]